MAHSSHLPWASFAQVAHLFLSMPVTLTAGTQGVKHRWLQPAGKCAIRRSCVCLAWVGGKLRRTATHGESARP